MPKKAPKELKEEIVDYDALMKEFITDFFPEFIAFVNPQLYEVTDWSKGVQFLEQELLNALKGRFKSKGKRKYTDKLVKVYLLSGEAHYIFIHVEFQHQPEPGFPQRMYDYRSLIYLRYGIEKISAIAVFTGASPLLNERRYYTETFGASVEYQYINLVAVEHEEAVLQASENPIAIALLAAKYTYETTGNPQERLTLKKKLSTLCQQRNIPLEKIVKLLTFVRDFISLPPKLENEFQISQLALSFSKSEPMPATQGSKDFAERIYAHVYGFKPSEALKAYKRQLAKEEKERNKIAEELNKAEEGRTQAEEERIKAEEERIKAEEEHLAALQKLEAERKHTILQLHKELSFSPPQIATFMELPEGYVIEVIDQDKKDETL